MPSFRAVLQIGDVRPGHDPAEVMAAAVDAVSAAHTVEATNIEVIARVPQIVVRFGVDPSGAPAENRAALDAARNMVDAVNRVAEPGGLRVLRRDGGRWKPV